jgi:hypothetical protein
MLSARSQPGKCRITDALKTTREIHGDAESMGSEIPRSECKSIIELSVVASTRENEDARRHAPFVCGERAENHKGGDVSMGSIDPSSEHKDDSTEEGECPGKPRVVPAAE